MAFHDLLKHWRKYRRMSQLELALEANVSTRHISFLETGRSNPSREMVLQLGTTMNLPQAGLRAMLGAAGFQKPTTETPTQADEKTAIAQAISWTLEKHNPYPAVALDRHWVLNRLNTSAGNLLAMVDLHEGDSLIDALVHESRVQDAVENLEEVVSHTRLRLMAEINHYGDDPILQEAVTAIHNRFGRITDHPDYDHDIVVPLRFNLNGLRLNLFSTLAQFTSIWDVATSELRLELFYPADEDSRILLEQFANC